MSLEYKSPFARVKRNRSLFLAAVENSLKASCLFYWFFSLLSSRKIAILKLKQAAIYNYIHTLNSQRSNNHEDIVKVVTFVKYHNRYKHQRSKNQNDNFYL